jgi:stage II sporulation protein P
MLRAPAQVPEIKLPCGWRIRPMRPGEGREWSRICDTGDFWPAGEMGLEERWAKQMGGDPGVLADNVFFVTDSDDNPVENLDGDEFKFVLNGDTYDFDDDGIFYDFDEVDDGVYEFTFDPYDLDDFEDGDKLNVYVNNYKIGVIHDKTVHNAILYNKAYARSGETLDKYLKQYDDFKLIIDLHRDASTDGKAVTVKLNGTNMARIEFVIGKANKSANKNIAITKDIIGISQNLFPGLVRQTNSNDFGIYYWNSYFNQNKSSNAILLEVGNEINTLDEAKASGTYIARIIAEYLNKKR